MKNTWMVMALLLLMILSACSKPEVSKAKSEDDAGEAIESVQETAALVETKIEESSLIESTSEAFDKKLADQGVSIQSKKIYAIEDLIKFGATEGAAFDIENMPIEIYFFDENSAVDVAKENLKSAKDSGYIMLYGLEINGETPKTACYIKDNWVLVFPMENYGIAHPKKADIVDVFLEMTFKEE